jgi:GDPmannose 4,6-dehydratase
VLATGENHSVREFVELAFAKAGITIILRGKGEKEQGRCTERGRVLVKIDPHYFRPTEIDNLIGDASKAYKQLRWKPKVGFRDLVHEMVAADLKAMSNPSNARQKTDWP